MFDACLLLNTEINLSVFGHDAKWTLIWQQHQYKQNTPTLNKQLHLVFLLVT